MNKIILLSLVLTLSLGYLHSQNNILINKDELINKALQSNLKIHYNQIKLNALQMGKNQFSHFGNTELSILMGQTNSIKFDENISINQELIHPAKIKASKEVFQSEINHQEILTTLEKKDLILEINLEWNNLEYLHELSELYSVRDTILNQIIQLTQKKIQSGETAPIELNQCIINQKINLEELRDLKRNQTYSIQKLSLFCHSNLDFEPIFTSLSEFKVFTKSTDAPSNHILVEIESAKIEKNNKQIDFLQKTLYPDFKFGYFIQSLAGTQEINSQLINFNSTPRFQGFQIGLSSPILQFYTVKKQKEMLTTLNKAIESDKDRVTQEINFKIKQIESNITYLNSALNKYRIEIIPLIEELQTASLKAYQIGEIEFITVFVNEEKLFEAKKKILELYKNKNDWEIWLSYYK